MGHPTLKRILTQANNARDNGLESRPLLMHEPRKTMETQISKHLFGKKDIKESGYESPVMVWSIDEGRSQNSTDVKFKELSSSQNQKVMVKAQRNRNQSQYVRI